VQDVVALDVGGRAIRVSSLDRVLFPAIGFSKAELLDYYVRVAPVLLPHLAGHPVTLHRFPEGVGGPHFFQTRTPPHPDWVRTQRMYTFRSGKEVDAPVIDDLAGLVWAVNLSTIELHPFLGVVNDLEHPRTLVVDLDPGVPAGLRDACAVALDVGAALEALGLDAYAKTSGGKGVHVVVPLAPGTPYGATKAVTRAIAATLARREPERVVDRMALARRAGRVFIDWSQNDQGKSTIAPYSVKALDVPTVATPVTWDEVDAVAAGRAEESRLWFTPREALDRVDRLGDLTTAVAPQHLPSV
jgi:bifunctional non-homologous end joining protein LigD